MEATEKDVLWNHMCQTLITAQAQRMSTRAYDPRVMLTDTQSHLQMDSKAAVRLNHTQVHFGLNGTVNHFTVRELEDEFDFLLEIQYRDPCQNIAAPLHVFKTTLSPDRTLVIGNWTGLHVRQLSGALRRTLTFADVMRVVLLVRDQVKNAITTVLIGLDPAPWGTRMSTTVPTAW